MRARRTSPHPSAPPRGTPEQKARSGEFIKKIAYWRVNKKVFVEIEAGHSGEQDPTRGEKMIRSELVKEISMCVSLPIEVISADQAFPFLKTTLEDLGIDESAVKERVVFVDTRRTQVRSKSGKLKEKEVSVLEIRVKAQVPGQSKCKEVLYSTESHTDRLYCRSGIFFVPWARAGDSEPVELTLALETQSHTTTDESEEQIPTRQTAP